MALRTGSLPTTGSLTLNTMCSTSAPVPWTTSTLLSPVLLEARAAMSLAARPRKAKSTSPLSRTVLRPAWSPLKNFSVTPVFLALALPL